MPVDRDRNTLDAYRGSTPSDPILSVYPMATSNSLSPVPTAAVTGRSARFPFICPHPSVVAPNLLVPRPLHQRRGMDDEKDQGKTHLLCDIATGGGQDSHLAATDEFIAETLLNCRCPPR